MERGGPGSIRRRASLAQGSATRTLAAGHAHLDEAPIDAGGATPWAGIRSRGRAIFPAQAPKLGGGSDNCVTAC